MCTPSVPEEIMPIHERWGLGVRVITDERHWLPVTTFGWSGAYGTHFWVDPENISWENDKNGVLYANEIIRYTQTLFEGFSSEGCMDFALPHLDYGLYVTFGNGFGVKAVPICDRFLPFFEVAYHGILLYNPMSTTVNYPIKDKNERLTLYLRGGKPSMYYYSKFRTGGAKNWMGETDLICNTEEELRKSVACIKRAAEEYFPERVAHYAERMGVDYKKISYRFQKSRWGSCSASGNLSFNCLLMLLVGEGRALARGAHGHDGVNALLDLKINKPAEAIKIYARFGKGSNESGSRSCENSFFHIFIPLL